MRGGFFRISLCLFWLFLFEATAAVGGEKETLRIASTLPKRLIDSIMAQGNWNILFQDGPFSEFQRQLAIGGHFALRGEPEAAEVYHRRAETALEIAYASVRSRFEWPRSFSQLKAADLPWGENRDTFKDYLLCRLQLYIETGLARHDEGKVGLERLQDLVDRTEKQLGEPLSARDADLESFVRLLRGSVALRTATGVSPGLRASRFTELGAALQPSARNYWRRRALLFQIQENLHYGNLGLARALTDFLFFRHGEQSDPLMLARFYIQSSDFVAATRLLAKESSRRETRSADNYADLLRSGEMLQNLFAWQKQYLRAAEVAEANRETLVGFLEDNRVPREEFVALRRAAADLKLRGEILRFIGRGECPSGLRLQQDIEMEAEWRVRERLFYEKCGLAVERERWQESLADASLGADARALVTFHLGKPAVEQPGDTESPLARYLRFYGAMAMPGAKARRAEKAIALLDAAGILHADLVLLRWGFSLPQNGTDRALEATGGLMQSAEAAELFSALHRGYARRHLRGNALFLFSPGDARELRAEIRAWLLGGAYSARTAVAVAPRGDFLYRDSERTVVYHFATGSAGVTVLPPWETLAPAQRGGIFRAAGTLSLFGSTSALTDTQGEAATALQIAPLFYLCTDCLPASRAPARLLLQDLPGNGWKSTRADLADIFSSQLLLQARPDCSFAPDLFQDTLIAGPGTLQAEFPCNLALENLIVDTAPAPAVQNLLWAVAGRQNGVAVLLPKEINPAARTAFLFDFLQRRNRREVPARQAFSEAQRRAEKSFPPGSGIEAVQMYAAVE